MSENMSQVDTFVLSELLPSDRFAFLDEDLLKRCKESTIAYLSRTGTIFTRDLNSVFVDELIDFFVDKTQKVPYIKLVTPEVLEEVLQLSDDELLSDIAESCNGGFDENSDELTL